MRCFSTVLITTALLTGPAAAQTFKDWQVSCDANRRCQAIGLAAGDPTARGYLTIDRQDAAAPAEIRFWVVDPTGNLVDHSYAIRADGKPVDDLGTPVRFAAPEEEGGLVQAMLVGDAAARLPQTLRRHRSLQLQDTDGSVVANVSLAGAAAAWLYMDDQLARNAPAADPAT